ncbi:MAG TPA: GTPase [Candidatus Lokiarchaeia archaeon]|nr:GTPase [Candidatus Lokiarchaeia archaeon]
MPQDPFKEFKHVPPIDEILETAWGKANKRAGGLSDKKDALHKAKKREILRIEVAYDQVCETLLGIVKSVPDLSTLPQFYFELAQLLVDNDMLKQKLGRISGVVKVLEKLKHQHIRAIPPLDREFDIKEKRKQAFGRMKSIVDKLASDFDYLRTARTKLKSLPVFDQTIPAIVIAGYPNVGKSSCVNDICGSDFKVAPYPFTTKEVIIGYYKYGHERIQFIDTPGVLDRPMSQRNNIELQAITAVKYVANIIVFMIDATMMSGYQVSDQLELLSEIQMTFPAIDRIILIAKRDLLTDDEVMSLTDQVQALGEETILPYSVMTSENKEKLLEIIKIKVKDFQPGQNVM